MYVYLDGINDYVSVGDSADLEPAGGFLPSRPG
jgi:hypothetical protein